MRIRRDVAALSQRAFIAWQGGAPVIVPGQACVCCLDRSIPQCEPAQRIQACNLVSVRYLALDRI